MDKTEFSQLHVLLVAGKTHSVHTLRTVMTMAGITRIAQVEDSHYAIELLGRAEFDAIFCDDACAAFNGLTFPQAVRVTASVRNPLLPIFVFREQAWRRTVERARDTGATGFITCPVSTRTIKAKLEEALANPRPFIKAPEFFGPDRRARDRASYLGQDRRRRTPRKIRVSRAGRPDPDTDGDPVML